MPLTATTLYAFPLTLYHIRLCCQGFFLDNLIFCQGFLLDRQPNHTFQCIFAVKAHIFQSCQGFLLDMHGKKISFCQNGRLNTTACDAPRFLSSFSARDSISGASSCGTFPERVYVVSSRINIPYWLFRSYFDLSLK